MTSPAQAVGFRRAALGLSDQTEEVPFAPWDWLSGLGFRTRKGYDVRNPQTRKGVLGRRCGPHRLMCGLSQGCLACLGIGRVEDFWGLEVLRRVVGCLRFGRPRGAVGGGRQSEERFPGTRRLGRIAI